MICQQCGERAATERVYKTTVNVSATGAPRSESIQNLCADCLTGVATPSERSPANYLGYVEEQIKCGVPRVAAIKQAADKLRGRLRDDLP